jgi:hypothetical protein
MNWQQRHTAAWNAPRLNERFHVYQIKALQALVAASEDIGWKIGEDGYAAEYVEDTIRNGIALLNMDTGRLDCGTLDATYRDLAEKGGIDLEG